MVTVDMVEEVAEIPPIKTEKELVVDHVVVVEMASKFESKSCRVFLV